MSRKHSREILLQKLYRDEFHSPFGKTSQKDLDFVFPDEALSSKDNQYVLAVLSGIKDKQEDIDQIINKYVENWRPERISLVDLNIMRIAVFEILFYPEVPAKAALNEALELAKKFGEKNSSSFINGILDQVFKKENV